MASVSFMGRGAGLGGAAAGEVEPAVGGIGQHLERRIAKRVRLDHRIHGAGLEGGVGALLRTGGDPGHRLVDADDPRQAHRAAPARQDAELGFRQADLCRAGHDPEVAGQADLEAAAHGVAVDRHHARKGQGLEAVEIGIVGAGKAGDVVGPGAEELREFGNVGADDEHRLARGYQQPAQALLGLQRIEGRGEVGDGGLVELVDRLAGEIEAQLGKVAIEASHGKRVTLVDHGEVLLL